MLKAPAAMPTDQVTRCPARGRSQDSPAGPPIV